MTNDFDIDSLILRVLDGIADPQEMLVLSRWVGESEENEVYFENLKKAWNLTSGPVPSVEREERELENYMTYIRSKRKKYSIRQYFKYAAILAIPLLAGVYLLWKERAGMESQTVVAEAKVVPGEYKATLITSGGQTITLLPSKQEDIQVDGDITVTNGQTGIIYPNTGNGVASSLEYNTLKTPRGGEYTLTLSDGTRVYLNAASELKFPVLFDSEKREVHLSGEAYFEVTKSTDRPFYVITDAVRVRVYGTSFNVNTNMRQGTQTVLVSGKVGISGVSSGKEYIMKPSQLAEFDRDGVFKGIREVDASVYTAWREGRFAFEDESLEEILERLSRWYDVEVVYGDESVKQYHFTGHMEKYEDVEVILGAISKMVGVHFALQGKRVVVTK